MLARLLQCPSGQAVVRSCVGGVDGLDALVAESGSTQASYLMGYYPLSVLKTEVALGAALDRATYKASYGTAFQLLNEVVA